MAVKKDKLELYDCHGKTSQIYREVKKQFTEQCTQYNLNCIKRVCILHIDTVNRQRVLHF